MSSKKCLQWQIFVNLKDKFWHTSGNFFYLCTILFSLKMISELYFLLFNPQKHQTFQKFLCLHKTLFSNFLTYHFLFSSMWDCKTKVTHLFPSNRYFAFSKLQLICQNEWYDFNTRPPTIICIAYIKIVARFIPKFLMQSPKQSINE